MPAGTVPRPAVPDGQRATAPWPPPRAPVPVPGRVALLALCPQRGRHCTDAILLCRPSSDSLLILRQSGGKRAGTSAEVGLFSGKTKAPWPLPRPRGCSGLEELSEDRSPKRGQLQHKSHLHYREAQPKTWPAPHPACHPTATAMCHWPLDVTMVAPDTLCAGRPHWRLPRLRARAATTDPEKLKRSQEKENPTLHKEMLLEAGNNFPPVARAPQRAQPSSPQPLWQVGPPLQAHFPAPGALPGRVQPRPPAGSPPGRGGSREGKNQKQIAGVNGAEPRAASAAAV